MHLFYKHIRIIILLVVVSLFSGCAFLRTQPVPPKETALYEVPESRYPEFGDDMMYDGLEHAISQSLSYLNRLPLTKQFTFGKDSFDTAHMIRSLTVFLEFIKSNPSYQKLERFVRSNYRIYRSAGNAVSGQVLFTGYYEPVLLGSLKPSKTYKFPIYAQPSDLSVIDLSMFSSRFEGEKIAGRYTNPEFVPYYDREEIEANGLPRDIAPPLVWVADKVDLFFLHIQGSGKIFLNNGQILNVHYHASNGRPYRSIGNYLIQEGKLSLSEMSMQAIRTYLKEHPDEMDIILNYNPSYVFFKLEEDGPLGFLEVKLTPGRSIALDRRLFPLAGLAFIETKMPMIDGDANIHGWTDLYRFVLTQDTGGAIRGPGRADLFWGNGEYAEIAAGYMKQSGNLYFLILKPDY